VAAVLETVKAQRESLEQSLDSGAAKGGSARRPPRPAAGGSRSSSFESFDDFRQSQPPKG